MLSADLCNIGQLQLHQRDRLWFLFIYLWKSREHKGDHNSKMTGKALEQGTLMLNTSEEPSPTTHPSREARTAFSSSYRQARRNCVHFSFWRLQKGRSSLFLRCFKASFQQPRRGEAGDSLPHLVVTGGEQPWRQGREDRGWTLPGLLVVLTLLHKWVSLVGGGQRGFRAFACLQRILIVLESVDRAGDDAY